MRNTKFRIVYFFLPLVVGLMSFKGCETIYNKSLRLATVEEGAIPPDFGENVKVLLFPIEKPEGRFKQSHKLYAKCIPDLVKKHYFGKYKILDIEEFKQSKYDDVDQYRYYFFYDVQKEYDLGADSYRIAEYYYVYDRKTESKYTLDYSVGNLKTRIKAYLIKLDLELEKR